MGNYSKFNSMADAVNAHIEKMLDNGTISGVNTQSQNVASALRNIADAYASQLTSSDAEEVAAQNNSNLSSIADQLYYLLDVAEPKVVEDNPLTALALDVNIGSSTDLLGKVVGDLQSDVTVTGRKIAGKLNYVTGYTGFSGDTEEQSGYYVAVHAEVPNVSGVTIKAKIHKEATLDSDGILIVRVTDDTPFTFTASKTGYADVVKTYDISSLEKLVPVNS